MKNHKRKSVPHAKERAILSDVLPYEVPIIFSNRYFYKFLVENKIYYEADNIHFSNKYIDDDRKAYNELLKLLFNLSTITVGNSSTSIDTKNTPFTYKIAHKEEDFRELTVIHPANQISLIDFYNTYKEIIIYYSKISKFSIRKPDAVAKYSLGGNKKNKDENYDLTGKEYENLKTFFSYQKYTNIYKFYEDYRYLRAEKKYKKLYKFDISKCFDSIYTHSIVWALTNKGIVKDNLAKSKKTFGGNFDRFIQNANSGETNGIVIGPEFSRIFAEIILQQIDKTVEQKLRIDENLYNKRDYEIYRYVDDYFLFCSNESEKDLIMKIFRHELKDFKMSLNDSKAKLYERPMITEISAAKQRINKLFDNSPIFKIDYLEDGLIFDGTAEEQNYFLQKTIVELQINPIKLITSFKLILKESAVQYKDVLNYTLAILNTKIEKIVLEFDNYFKVFSVLENKKELLPENILKKGKLENDFSRFIVSYLDFVFFIYSVSPRVNSSIKLSNILSKIINLFKGVYHYLNLSGTKIRFLKLKNENKELIFKKISDEISFVLGRHQMDKQTQVEILYLLVSLRELGKNYRLNSHQLANYFNCVDKENGEIIIGEAVTLNYFSIVVLLFYMKNIKIYDKFKNELQVYIKRFILSIDSKKRAKNTETNLLIMDLIVCPYLNDDYKSEIIKLFGIDDLVIPAILNFKQFQKYWFVKWDNFNLAKELDSKNSDEVYS